MPIFRGWVVRGVSWGLFRVWRVMRGYLGRAVEDIVRCH